MKDDSLQATATQQPKRANLRLTTGAKELTEDDRQSLATDLYSSWESVRTARRDFNENLRAFSALYEMEVSEQDSPWVGAANLVVPIIPAELDAMLAYVAAQVIVPRTVIVTAADGDPETARLAPKVEKHYNAELRRIRSDGKTPIEQALTVLHLGLRDGGGPCDVVFSERVEPKLVVTEEPKVGDDEETGESRVLIEDGEIVRERVVTRVEETIAEVNIVPRLLKEWYLGPDESTSIQSALSQMSVVWMTEKQMNERVAEGVFDADAVERVLQRLTAGQTDVSSDPEGSYDKDAGGQINVGQGQGSVTSKFFRNRGPARLIRIFSEQFDMNDDTIAEKNVFWIHPDYPEILGWMPYEYMAGEWPTFMFAPFPRPDRPYGYSLVERLADITAEANAGRNQRRNYLDLIVLPVLLRREGDDIRDKDHAFYPGAEWVVPDVEGSIKWFVPPQMGGEVFGDESQLMSYVSKLTGQGAPATGAQSSSRRSATESRQQAVAQSTRSNLVAMMFRSWLRAVMQFWHKLDKQYLVDTGKALTSNVPGEGQYTITAAELNRKYNIDIAGLSDPTDAGSQRQEIMAAIGVAEKAFPWIFQDQVKSYELAYSFFETFNWGGVERIIGTAEDAAQRQQQQQQAQAAMAQQAQQQQAQGQPGAGGGGPKPGDGQ